MWIAGQWKDYEIIDCSKGEKLERWGDYTLIRPDPQVIWDFPREAPGWKRWNGHYHRSKKGGGEWEFSRLPEQWQIHYRSLTFNLKPFNFKHTGLFPEQAANWDWFSGLIQEAGRPVKVLNLFAYTGGGRSRGTGYPCGCLQGDGCLGEGKRGVLRPEGCAHPVAGGRLCKVRRTGDPAWKCL